MLTERKHRVAGKIGLGVRKNRKLGESDTFQQEKYREQNKNLKQEEKSGLPKDGCEARSN